MAAFLFYSFSGIAILSAFCVITHPKPTRALLALMVTMFSLAVLYILLGAPFVAMVHLIVYAGAILVLFLFVIMMSGIGAQEIPFMKRFHPITLGFAIIVGLALVAVLGVILMESPLAPPRTIEGTVKIIGRRLFRDYLLVFELISLPLLLGILAAVALAKKEET